MHRFAVFATMAAVLVAATAAADAASRKKPRVGAERSAVIAAKHKPHYVSKPAAAPWNQPRQSNQGWPTSWSDGSFRYGN